MNIKTYTNRLPDKWLIKDSFFDRNPNLSYLVTYGSDTLHSVLIDVNVSAEELEKDLDMLGSKMEWILITHTHLDHSFRLPEIVAKYGNVRVGIPAQSLISPFIAASRIECIDLVHGMEIKLGEESLRVLSTPGHTTDTVCFWDKENQLFFSGDVIMEGEIGCCDYHSGGSRNVFYQTIIDLLKLLPDSTQIFPGHRLNYYSTPPPYLWKEEKKRNPYLQFAAAGNKAEFYQELKGFSCDRESDAQLTCRINPEHDDSGIDQK